MYVVWKQNGGKNLQKIRLGPQLGDAEALAGLGITGLEQVVEEVTSVSVLAQLSTLRQLALAVGHVASTAGGQLGEEDLVELELVHDWHGAAN
jgi:hypothetical protein